MPEMIDHGRMRGCPGTDAIAAYVDGTLPASRRAEITVHLGACERCYELVAEVAHLHDAEGAEAAPTMDGQVTPLIGRFNRRRLVLATGSLAAAAALLLTFVLPGANPHERRVRALVEAVGEQRIYEGRLTGGFQYGPLHTPPRSGSGALSDNLSLAAAAGDLQKTAKAEPTPANLHAWGIAALLLGDQNDAVKALESAAATEPGVAELQSDLAAAYIQRARNAGRDDDWPRAVQAAERALRLNGDLLEASFNRAVALEALGLRNEAIEAWRQYLKQDPDSQWSEAARAALAKLEAGARSGTFDSLHAVPAERWPSLARANAQRVREHVEDTLLPSWARAVRANDVVIAAEYLAQSRRVAEALAAATGDPLPLENVRAIESGACPLATHADAYMLWSKGRSEYAKDRMDAMTATFGRAAPLFERCGNPQALWARHYLIVGDYYAGRIVRAERQLEELRGQIAGRNYVALEARLAWDAGTLAFQRASFERATKSYVEAQATFARATEPGNEAAVSQLLAEAYARLGQYGRSWEQSRRALARLPLIPEARRRYSMLAGAGTMALNQGLPDTAVRFFRASLAEAYDFGGAGAIVGTHQNLSRALAEAGDLPGAAAQIAEARRHLSSIPDAGIASKFGADLLAADAHLTLRSDPAAAVVLAERAIETYRGISSEYRLASMHLVRGRGKRAVGDLTGAAEAFDEGLRYLESKRALTTQAELRISYVDSVWDLYGDAVALHAIDLGQPVNALAYAERGRARALLESRTGSAVADAAHPADIAAHLAAGEAMLYLSTHEQETLAWILDRSGARSFTRAPIGRAEADRMVARLRKALQAGSDEEAAVISREIWTRVIGPLRPALRGASRLIIVADAHWQQLPFACLQDPATGRYLVEDVALVMTPSATLYAALTANGVERATHRTAAILVASGAVEESGLRSLPHARQEAHNIAALYADPDVFADTEATPQRMRQSLATYRVVHFAGHAIADPVAPWQSRLLLNPGANGETALKAEDVATTRARARVVVLAACRTADGPLSRAEGLMSLARPFVAAGVRSVVATLWDVEDGHASGLSEKFHREFIRTGDAAAALQRAQISSIGVNRGSGISAWSSFVVVGA